MRIFLSTTLCLLTAGLQSAQAENWSFPLTLNDENTSIEFEVDSTWHRIEGKAKGVAGLLNFTDGTELRSLQGNVSVTVATFNTESSSRDERLRGVMSESSYPKVTYELLSSTGNCDQNNLSLPCPVTIHGRLKIKETSKPLDIKGVISRNDDRYQFEGTTALQWAAFGVEDPSILVARLHPNVQIKIKTHWR